MATPSASSTPRCSPADTYAECIRFYRNCALHALFLSMASSFWLVCMAGNACAAGTVLWAALTLLLARCSHKYVRRMEQQWLGLYFPIYSSPAWAELAPELVRMGFRSAEDVRELSALEVERLSGHGMRKIQLNYWNAVVRHLHSETSAFKLRGDFGKSE
jgi:hypothetical protein